MAVFLNQLLQNSLCATLLILAILLFRRLTGELSKLYVHLLWLITLLVLVLPPIPLGSLHTPRGLIPETELTFSQKQNGTSQKTQAENATEAKAPGESPEAPIDKEAQDWANGPEDFLYRGQGIGTQSGIFGPGSIEMFLLLWAVGALLLLAVNLAEWLRLKKRVAIAVRIRKDVWRTNQIDTPFVMPGMPSRIYIPQGLEQEEEQLEDILKHERRHIRNRDPWIKCFAVLVLILHWFNPFVWLAYRLMNRDMEMYCDECVLKGKSMVEKKHYAQTLLDFACKSRGFSPAVYFGESSTKKRIRHVLYTKRPRAAVSLLLLLLISGCGMSFLSIGEEMPMQVVVDTLREELLPKDSFHGAGVHWEEDNTESEELWTEKTIVGTGHPGVETGLDEAAMSLMSETEQFALYSMQEGNEMAVKTPECLVYAEVPVISNYGIEPQILEQDFDNDGEPELAIITYVLHGTGISMRSLFMTDRAADSSWNIYQYRDQDYLDELTPHFDTQYGEESARLLFDGVPTGVTEQVDPQELEQGFAYYAGSQIDFRFVEEKILFRSQLAGYSQINFSGTYVGHELDAQVRYQGEGEWQLTDIRYADAGITEVIETAIPLYLTGQTSEIVNEHYTVPGTKLSDFQEPGEEVTILSILYPTDELDSGEVEAYVTIRQDGEDSLQYLHVPLKKVPLDYGGSWWRIAGEISVER